jgi:SAM-dependent methyltransferase
MLTGEVFFDKLSEYYDEMINFEPALSRRKDMLKSFIIAGMKDAADLGCGTGLDSISLALDGLNVTSFDIADGMLEQAAIRADELDISIDFHKYSLPDIPEEFYGKFDLAVSMGNTMAVLENSELKPALNKAFNMLRENGCLVVQILNFPKLINNSNRIVNITAGGEKHFVRFYDFLPGIVNFNVLSYSSVNPNKYDLLTTKLNPYSADEMTSTLKEAGFAEINTYGGLNKSGFEPDKSNDVVILARK